MSGIFVQKIYLWNSRTTFTIIEVKNAIKIEREHFFITFGTQIENQKIHIPLIICMKFEYKILMFKDTHQNQPGPAFMLV